MILSSRGWLIFASMCNFLLWWYVGRRGEDEGARENALYDVITSSGQGAKGGVKGMSAAAHGASARRTQRARVKVPLHPLPLSNLPEPLNRAKRPWLEVMPTHTVTAYKEEQVPGLRLPESSIMLNVHANSQADGAPDRASCRGYVHMHTSQKWSDEACVAVVHAQALLHTPPLLRFKGDANKAHHALKKTYPDTLNGIQARKTDERQNIDASGHRIFKYLHSASADGLVNQIPGNKDRLQLRRKMENLLTGLSQIERLIAEKLQPLLEQNQKDVVLMTVNPGEMDMLVNFACSCSHHKIKTTNMVVFAASASIVESITALGFIAIYTEEFEQVSSHASAQYLDPIFVDMMWYKSFSVWILLKMRFNVLFQDVDLVWFKEPFSYFASHSHVGQTQTDAFFSDDGQRGLRYAPFYANSGFYFLKANSRTEYLAWLTLLAFDSVKVTGSHQNVFVSKLTECLDIARLAPSLLNLDDFPTGVKYHRDKPYMKAIQEGWKKPYNFHMCWTLNKKNKIEYFQNVEMWYIQGSAVNTNGDGGGNSDAGDECALAAAYKSPDGSVYKKIKAISDTNSRKSALLHKCCKNPKKSQVS